MADLNIEKKPRSNGLWFAIIAIVIAVGVWFASRSPSVGVPEANMTGTNVRIELQRGPATVVLQPAPSGDLLPLTHA